MAPRFEPESSFATARSVPSCRRSGSGRIAFITILGTGGYIEVRKNVDLAGRAGGNHLFLADAKGVRYVDCNAVELPFGRQLVDDVMHRTETAMTQAHCFLTAELALLAQSHARIIE